MKLGSAIISAIRVGVNPCNGRMIAKSSKIDLATTLSQFYHVTSGRLQRSMNMANYYGLCILSDSVES